MVSKKTSSVPQVTVQNCSVVNTVAAISPEAAAALTELAIASAEHAKAIAAIANALKGAEARMNSGFNFGGS